MENNSGSKGERSDGCATRGNPIRGTECRSRKAGGQGGQNGSKGRSEVCHGQGEAGPRNPRESGRFQQGGCQQNIDQNLSKEGPKPTPMTAHFKARDQPDGSPTSKRSPHRGPVSDQGLDAHAARSDATVCAQSGVCPKPQEGDSEAPRGRPTKAASLPRAEVTAAPTQPKHQRGETKGCDHITSSQKEEELVDPPLSGGD